MNKTRFFMLIVVLLLSLALVGLALAADAVPQKENPPPDENTAQDTINNEMDSTPAPFAAWPGPDGYGYTSEVITINWVNITASGTPIVGLTDDNFAGPFPQGFSFSFYGTPWTEFYASSNGFLTFGAGSSYLTNQCPLPNSSIPDNVVAMMWDDLNFNTSGNAYYQTFETCPIGTGACTIVEYYNVAHYGGAAGSAGTWETIFFDNGDIMIQILDSGTELGSWSTTGIEDHDYADGYGLTYACDVGASIPDNLAIYFTYPIAPNLRLSTKTAPSSVEVGNPISYTITIRNAGNLPAENATLVDPIPAGTTYNDDVACDAGVCGYSAIFNRVEWFGVVPVAGEVTLSFTVGIAGLHCGEIINNQATIDDPGMIIEPVIKSTSTTLVSTFYYLEDFEANDGGYVNVGTNLFNYGTPPQNAPRSGMNSWATDMPYAASAWYELHSPWIDLSTTNPHRPLMIQWWQDIFIESAVFDHAYVEITTDDVNWTVLWEHTGATYHSPGWEHKSFDITPYRGQSIKIRFRMTSDDFVQYEGWAIDDISIYAGCLPPDIDVNPPALEATLLSGLHETQPLTICNTGEDPLSWGLFEVPNTNQVTSVLYDNGPLITHPGAGFNGADASAVQTALLLSIYGFGDQLSAGNRIADSFEVTNPQGWVLSAIQFYSYQTGIYADPPVSTITAVNYRIWDSEPPTGTVICGDVSTNMMTNTSWSGIYRALDTALLSSTRPIMLNTVSIWPACSYLAPGTYWLDWQTDGSLGSGPWVPPISILGQTTTGNALQSLSDNGVTWNHVVDGGTFTPQGMPFRIEGTIFDNPWLSEDPTSGVIMAGECTDVAVTFNANGLDVGDYFGDLQLNSNDPVEPSLTIPVTLHVVPFIIEKLAPSEAFTGDSIPYTITLDYSSLTGTAVLTDVIPLGATYLPGSLTCNLGACSYDSGTNSVYWSSGVLMQALNPPTPPLPLTTPHPVELTLGSIEASGTTTHAPIAPEGAIPLIVDDGSFENSIGLNSISTANQFIWFNRFTPAPADFPFVLNQIQIIFGITANSNVNVGDAIDLVVYQDADGDPSNGATWLATYNVTVQAADGTTWSIYDLTSPLLINGPGDVLIAAINRFTETGVSPPTWPAAIDTTASQLRSWVGSYSADPPDPAILPSDGLYGTIDSFGFPGNWMIRGYGETYTGAHVTISFNASVTSQSEPVVNTAELSMDGYYGTASATTHVTSRADLATTKTGPEDAYVGQPITYTINVANLGPDDATDVVILDTLPTGATFLSAPGFCSHTTGVVTCNVPLIDPGGSSNFEIAISMAGPGLISNTVTATAAQLDVNPGNNTATVQNEVAVYINNFYLPVINK
jgi:uncharacterized repeat protein (TIGR01451 family)